ncbi:MAG: HAD family hydrolase [Prolixibacteraceae bacterium]|nr:HAD family hydrolase [Prolixibacteraceae bacterium]
MESIEQLLIDLPKLEPIQTGTQAVFHKDESIKAVVFDIYGTLLISSSGDVEEAEMSVKNLEKAFRAGNIEVIPSESVDALQHILHDFEYTIDICHREAKKNEVPYPEIDILSIWEIVLLHARRKKLIQFNGEANVMEMTCVFEFLSNKVYPMPGFKATVEEINQKGLPLGIVSNAQFYTPVLMNYFLGRGVQIKEEIEPFDPELTVYSYKLGVGKPEISLFNELLPVLKNKYNLKPEEVLFVGNDMLKDIYTSSRAGFKTALFAGDRRSLRLRSDDERVKGLKPDFIVTDLKQIFEIIS